ncbi:MAG: NUDIX domain-containing protein [Chloroflexota bacterium]
MLGQRSAARPFYPAVWDVFGGHVEPGERYDQTLVRELQEELGITPTQWTYLKTRTSLHEPADTLTLHLYVITAWEGTPVNRQLDEHSEIGWFSLAQATQLKLADPTYPELFSQHMDS